MSGHAFVLAGSCQVLAGVETSRLQEVAALQGGMRYAGNRFGKAICTDLKMRR